MNKGMIGAAGIGLLLVLNVAASELVEANPALTADGTIQAGPKSIVLKAYYAQFWMYVDRTTELHAQQMFNLGEGDLGTVFFLDRKHDIDVTNQQVVCTAKMRASRASQEALGDFRISMRLQEDGRIAIASEYSLYDPEHTPLRADTFSFALPTSLTAGNAFVLDGVEGRFPAADKKFGASREQPRELVLCPEDELADSSFGITFMHARNLHLNQRRVSFRPDRDGKLEFVLDFRKVSRASLVTSAEAYSGIDFWADDRLRVPQYGLCRNLIQNPSFEGGLHYYRYQNHGPLNDFRIKWLYRRDATIARFGKHSLLMRAVPKSPYMPLPMHHMIVPVDAGESYVFSFYAKGSVATGLRVAVSGRTARGPLTHPAHGRRHASGYRVFDVDDQWQRYSLDIPTKDFALSMGLAGLADPSLPGAEGRIWIDGIQLEKNTLTPYAEKPVCAQLMSAAPGNFVARGQAPDMRLRLALAHPGMTGSAAITVTDFFGRTVVEQSQAFKTDADGSCVLAMPEVNDRFPRGIFLVEANIKLEDGFAYREILRFSVMDFLKNKHRNKGLITNSLLHGPSVAAPDFERYMARWRDIGIGSALLDSLGAERMAVLEAYGISSIGEAIMHKRAGTGSIAVGDRRMTGITDIIDPTDAQLKEFEELCALKAAANPAQTIWWFAGECRAGCQPLSSHLDAFAKFLVATYRGVKRGNPEANVLLTGGPWNTAPNSGIKWNEGYIKATQKVAPEIRFDGISSHIYRPTPENGDLDSDLAALIAMTDRNGYAGAPIYISEGMNYFPMTLPVLGINPHQGNSAKWVGGSFTYDIGDAERIAAAYYARSWLVAFKYQDRIQCMDGHEMRTTSMDFDLTPYALQKIMNTLGRFLGDAAFREDIRFAPLVRAYVFEDDQRRPVAAVWSHIPAVDRGKRDAPLAMFPFRGALPQVYDLMENTMAATARADGSLVVPVGSHPIFLVGVPGTLPAMAQALHGAKLLGAVPAESVTVQARPVSTSAAEITFRNLLSQPFTGNASVTFAGTTETFALELGSAAAHRRTINAAQPLDRATLETFRVTTTLTGAGVTSAARTVAAPALFAGRFSPVLDGALDEWTHIPFIPLPAGTATTFQAAMKLAWDDTHLYLAAQVMDTALKGNTRAEVKQGIIGDALSLCIDTWGNGPSGLETALDDNDYCYRFLPSPDASEGITYCAAAPFTQADSGKGAPRGGLFDEHITCRVRRVANGTAYELALPRERLLPLKLERGVSFGLSAAASDGNVAPASGQAMVALPALDWRNPRTFALVTLID